MSHETPALRADRLTLRFGRKTAVDDVSFDVRNGSVYALLGRNGAGKSTLVRCLLGQLRPDRGRAVLLGQDVWRRRATLLDRIGIVPEEADAPPALRLSEIARFFSRSYSRWSQRLYDDRLSRFEIAPNSRFGELSKGQKKQVMLALSLATSPELLILHDPTLGLDVVARRSLFEEVIGDLGERRITVLITTHDLASVEAIADRIGILERGRLILDEDAEILTQRFRRIRVAAPPVAVESHLTTQSVIRWGSGTEAIVSNYDESTFERLRESDLAIAEVSAMSLEEIFVAVTGEMKGASA